MSTPCLFLRDPKPSVMEITDIEALTYVSELIETLLNSDQEIIPRNDNDLAERRPSYEVAVDSKPQVLTPLMPVRDYKNTTSPDSAIIEDDEEEKLIAFDSYKRFWLKETPPISIRDYLKRFHRYCRSSPATYLTTGCLIYNAVVEKKSIPLTNRNVYRIFCAAFIISAKFIEDELYPMSRYATTAGLKKQDLSSLEISFLLLINFDIKINREILTQELKKWASLVESA